MEPDTPSLPQIAMSLRPSLRADVAVAFLDGEAVLFAEESGHMAVVNSSAALVVQCIDGLSSLDEISIDVAEVFGVDLATIQAQVYDVVSELGGMGFLGGLPTVA